MEMSKFGGHLLLIGIILQFFSPSIPVSVLLSFCPVACVSRRVAQVPVVEFQQNVSRKKPKYKILYEMMKDALQCYTKQKSSTTKVPPHH